MECEIETWASYLLDIIVAMALGQKQWNWFAPRKNWMLFESSQNSNENERTKKKNESEPSEK